jgi:hypothetical protein
MRRWLIGDSAGERKMKKQVGRHSIVLIAALP